MKKSAEEVERLVTEHLPVARMMAAAKCGIPSQFDEVFPAALEGLWQAVVGHDPARASLKTYVNRKVKHRINDYFRKVNGRTDVINERSGLGTGSEKRGRHVQFITLDYLEPGTDEPVAMRIPDESSPCPSAELLRSELCRRVRQLFNRTDLKDQERQVLLLHFFEDFSLEEIAARFGLTYARIHQVRQRAMQKLRLRSVELTN